MVIPNKQLPNKKSVKFIYKFKRSSNTPTPLARQIAKPDPVPQHCDLTYEISPDHGTVSKLAWLFASLIPNQPIARPSLSLNRVNNTNFQD